MDIFNTYTLINEHTGDMAFRIWNFEDNGQFCKVKRLNHYSLIWIKKEVARPRSIFPSMIFPIVQCSL